VFLAECWGQLSRIYSARTVLAGLERDTQKSQFPHARRTARIRWMIPTLYVPIPLQMASSSVVMSHPSMFVAPTPQCHLSRGFMGHEVQMAAGGRKPRSGRAKSAVSIVITSEELKGWPPADTVVDVEASECRADPEHFLALCGGKVVHLTKHCKRLAKAIFR
jgi:hypothetical protein